MQEQPEQEVPTGVKGCSHDAIATVIFSSQQIGDMGFHVIAHTYCTGLGTEPGLGPGQRTESTVHIAVQGMV